MTTAVRITHLGGNRNIRISEDSKNEHGIGAVITELVNKGDEHTVHVHSTNKFVIEEFAAAQTKVEG